jgi:hypothetical protein
MKQLQLASFPCCMALQLHQVMWPVTKTDFLTTVFEVNLNRCLTKVPYQSVSVFNSKTISK